MEKILLLPIDAGGWTGPRPVWGPEEWAGPTSIEAALEWAQRKLGGGVIDYQEFDPVGGEYLSLWVLGPGGGEYLLVIE